MGFQETCTRPSASSRARRKRFDVAACYALEAWSDKRVFTRHSCRVFPLLLRVDKL